MDGEIDEAELDPISNLNDYVESKVRRMGKATPPTPGGRGPVIDVHFEHMIVDESVDREVFIGLIVAAEGHGRWATMKVDILHECPSYMVLGGILGTQVQALMFMALGAAAGIWEILTPAGIGIHGELADLLAGYGVVTISGFYPLGIPDSKRLPVNR